MSKRKQAEVSQEQDKRLKPNAKQSYNDVAYEAEIPETSDLELIAELMQKIKARHTTNLELCEELDRLPLCTKFETFSKAHDGDFYEFVWAPNEKKSIITYPTTGKRANTIEKHLSMIMICKPKECVARLQKLHTWVDDVHVEIGLKLQHYHDILLAKLPHAFPHTLQRTFDIKLLIENTATDNVLIAAMAMLKLFESQYTASIWKTAFIDKTYYQERANELFSEDPLMQKILRNLSFSPHTDRFPYTGLFLYNAAIYYAYCGKKSNYHTHYYTLSGEAEGTIFCPGKNTCPTCAPLAEEIVIVHNSIEFI